MISKVLDGHSFGPACKYICDRKEAEILEAEGVREDNYKEMAMDFQTQAELREHKNQACFHAILSFHPDDKVDKEMMKEITRKYLEGIGVKNTQYVIVLHTDKDHPHLHVLANMVNYDGRSISNAFIGKRGKDEAIALTKAYGLIPADRKDLSKTNLEALNEYEANKYKIFLAIMESLPRCRSMEELEARLQKQGITVQYKYKSGTEQKQGISFKIGEDCIKGSKVDRQYSLTGLEKILEQNRRQAQEDVNQDAAGHSEGQKGTTLSKGRKMLPATPPPSVNEPLDTSGSILGSLLNPLPEKEEDGPYIPRKRKRKNIITTVFASPN